MLELKLEAVAEDVMEITDGADKQLKIENDLKEIDGIWQVREFSFKDWKTRAVPTLQGTGLLMEELEEARVGAANARLGALRARESAGHGRVGRTRRAKSGY